ncbi:hypothetical protein OCU04_010459 [Sclerotinia nivalis]|uniref:Rhodopsin domain-containing protein n=1 Tax=Sclerotinia nivalis TaxID=352851 RepID=A0A9X0AFS1_9HELO|nr:hypothetical protein OCU04_010459 [Sclerotinia nivalis]
MAKLDQNSRALLGVSFSFTIFAVVTVLLRLYSRKSIKLRWSWDDIWVVAAAISLGPLCGLTVWSAIVGGAENLNKDSKELQVASFETFLKAQFIASPFYLFTMTAARLSLTCLYRFIFPVQSLRLASIAVDTFSIAYFLSALFGNVFSCDPIDFLWHPTPTGSCFAKFNLFVVITESFGVFLDFVVLTLPIRSILKLQMPMRTKVLVIAIFCLGGFVVVTGIARVVLIYNSTGAYVNFLNSDIWTSIHACTGVICVSLPTFKPLYPKIAAFTTTLRRRYGMLRYATFRRSPTTSNKAAGGHSSTNRASSSQEALSLPIPTTTAGKIPAYQQSYELNSLDPDQIRVKRTFDVA